MGVNAEPISTGRGYGGQTKRMLWLYPAQVALPLWSDLELISSGIWEEGPASINRTHPGELGEDIPEFDPH